MHSKTPFAIGMGRDSPTVQAEFTRLFLSLHIPPKYPTEIRAFGGRPHLPCRPLSRGSLLSQVFTWTTTWEVGSKMELFLSSISGNEVDREII